MFKVLGDQQAALVGQMCFNKGEAKNTYGLRMIVRENWAGSKDRGRPIYMKLIPFNKHVGYK